MIFRNYNFKPEFDARQSCLGRVIFCVKIKRFSEYER